MSTNDRVRSGLDLRWVDPATRPQDDLYGHVNGRWLATAEIPDDRAQHGMLRALRDDAEADVRTIVEELASVSVEGADGGGVSGADRGPDDRRIGDLYTSFLDVDAIEARGTEPLRPLLEEIAAAPDRAALAEVLGRRQREGLVGLFWATVATYVRDSSRPLVHLSQAGLGLPDESYYAEDGDPEILDRYREHLARVAELAELPDPEGLAACTLDLETALSHAWMDQVSLRDLERTNTVMSWGDLGAHAAGFDWTAWLAGLGADESAVAEVVVGQPLFLAEVGRLWRDRPLEQWKAWLTVRLLAATAQYLATDLADADFDFHGRAMCGIPDQPERWRRAVSLVEVALGDAVGRHYVARHFSASARDSGLELVRNLVEAYRRSLTDLDWMGPETRRRALDKLGRLSAKIGYPDRWKDYSALEIRADDLLGNVRRAGAWRTGHDLAKIGRPVDRDEWLTTPQTVNAFYNPRLNEVVFPAAVLQPPLFDPDADDAANYGGIGSTIGHEIGHGFDDQGSQYDGDGNLIDWWEAEDRAEFDRRAQALAAQFDALSPAGLPGHTVNGALTLGENIGDLGGMVIALRAYHLAAARTGQTEPPVIDGLTGDQRLLFAYAGVWRAKTREEEAIRRLASDPHAPPDLRCNAVVTNLDAFYDAFEVTDEDALFTPESERVRIW